MDATFSIRTSLGGVWFDMAAKMRPLHHLIIEQTDSKTAKALVLLS